jgi:hypothetical protein
MQRTHMAFGAFALAVGLGCNSQGTAQVEGAGTAKKEEAVVNAGAVAKTDADASAKLGANTNVDADASAKVDANAAAALTPRIGGTIVVAGDYNVEILAFVDGRIEAILMDMKGELVADANAKLKATLAAKGDARAQVDLKWDVELARFVGKVEGDIVLVPGPLELELDVGGKVSAGALAELGLAAQASHGGQMMVAGQWSVELAAEAGVVHAYAFDVSGKAHAAGDLDLDLALEGAGDIDLVWDPPSASYTAKLDAGIDIDAKPIVLKVAADGKIAMAAVHSFHASAKADADATLAAGAKLDADARVKAPKVNAKAGGGAKADVGAKASGKASTKKSASAKADADGGSFKASAKAKGGFKIGS